MLSSKDEKWRKYYSGYNTRVIFLPPETGLSFFFSFFLILENGTNIPQVYASQKFLGKLAISP